MWERLKPFTNGLARKLHRGRSLQDASLEVVVVQPEEVEHHDLPLHLPGQLGKATKGWSGPETLDLELAIATATRVTHVPTIRHTLADCLVHPAGVDFPGGSYRIQPLRAASLIAGRVRRVPSAVYCMSAVSHEYFGHWLQDACSTALLKRDEDALLLAERPNWPHAGQYLQAFGFRPEPFDLLHVERLTLYQDHGQGSSKRQRYAELRRRLEVAYPELVPSGPRVYFRRGTTGVARFVANEEAVIASLSARGFEVFDLAGASVREVQTRFRHAECIVSMDGSHLNHLYFAMQPGGKLMTFVPADRFTMVHIGYCVAAEFRYGFMVVDPTPAGYEVSLPDLHATLDLMDV